MKAESALRGGEVKECGHRFEELQLKMRIDPSRVCGSIEAFIRNHVESLEREGVILGLSGGVDSAVAALLCVRAVGPEKTTVLIMPDKDSAGEHRNDALHLAREFALEPRLIDITPYLECLGAYDLFVLNRLPLFKGLRGTAVKRMCDFYETRTGETPFSATLLGFRGKPWGSYLRKGSAYYRIKHRLRMILLYLYGEQENRLVVGGANKTEYRIGLFVKHGCDHATDIMPLLNLYKTQVRELARYLNVPPRIIEKPPSPDLIPGIVDEQAIGMPYDDLDPILCALEAGWRESEISEILTVRRERVAYVHALVQRSEHMRRVFRPDGD